MTKLLLSPQDYEYYSGRSFQDDFNERLKLKERIKKTATKKIPIPAVLRWQVWERDNFTCQKCGTRKHLAVDHIYPESLGGKATLENCQTLCRKCNSKKGNRI